MKNILFVTIDSLRADHVGRYGYDRETSPVIDRLADAGHRFSNAFAHAGTTRKSFPTILTSSYPSMYGGYERISEERTLVSEALEGAGYATAGFHSNLYLSADFGYGRGFETFYDSKTDPSLTARARQMAKERLDSDGLLFGLLKRGYDFTERQTGQNVGSAYVTADEITDRAVTWARKSVDRPRFLWVHYMDVHHPYVPPAEHQRAFREEPIDRPRAVQLRRKMLESPADVTDDELDALLDLYDAEIRYTDSEIGRLVENVRDAWQGDTLVAVTADHGEEFRDHGGFSHNVVYDEGIHVPLVLDFEGREGSVVDDIVGLVDVAPTFLEYANAPAPDSFFGTSLLDLLENDDWDRTAIVGDWDHVPDADRGSYLYRDARWKYIRQDGEEELYDLTTDPAETENVAGRAGSIEPIRSRVANHVEAIEATSLDLGTVEMDETVRRRLRDLGYQE